MAAHPGPVAVTLVSGSPDDLRWFQREVDFREWEVIQLHEFCGGELTLDPMLDYTDEFVLRKVIGQDFFPAAVAHIIACAASPLTVSNSPSMMCAIKIFIVGDMHRSSVTSACAESQLNSLVYSVAAPGYAPSRAWNCNWFSFNKCSGTWTWQQQVDNIRDWVHAGGFHLTVAPATEIEMFGYVAATKSASSSTNWKELSMVIEGDHLRIWHEGWASESMPQDGDRDRGESMPQDGDRDREIECPEWVTFNKDAKVWRKYLDKMGVDEPAQQSLFLLAQDDYWEANSIISKLIKKVVDHRVVHNPSGFVFSSVLTARNKGKPSYKCDRCGPQPGQGT
jgi:hypothetical protein